MLAALGAAPLQTAAQRDIAASRLEATAPSRRLHARHTHAVSQSGGGGGEALTVAHLTAALRPIAEGLDELRCEFAAQRSVTGATSENVAALVELAAGAAVASSEWSRAHVNSLSELCGALLACEEGGDESRAVVRLLCASLAPDVRAPLPGAQGVS